MPQPLFHQITLIGIGLINSSLAHNIRLHGLATRVVIADINPTHVHMAQQLGLGTEYASDNAKAVQGADLVVIGTPLLAMTSVIQQIASYLKPGCIVTDVGSVKSCIVRDFSQYLPAH